MSNRFIAMISQYQSKIGVDIMPSQTQLNNEIMFNKLNIFPKITLAYISLGFIMLFVAFIVVFNPNIKPRKNYFYILYFTSNTVCYTYFWNGI